MAHWSARCLWMCLIVLTTTAYRFSDHSADCDEPEPHYFHRDYRPPQVRPVTRGDYGPISRIDHEPTNNHAFDGRALVSERSTHDRATQERTNDRPNGERTNTRPSRDRANERSIPFTSDAQRIPDQERKHTRVLDFVPALENGTLKILNNARSSLTSRRGQVEEDSPRQRDSVVFPGDSAKGPGFMPLPQNLPEDCMKIGICEDVLYYPEERVNSIIEKLGDTKDKFKVDEQLPPELTQRIGPPDELELCDFTEKIMIPRAAADKDGKWHFIINQKPNPLQGVRVEICRNDKKPCSEQAYFYTGYEARCKQKYALRYMTALDERGATVEQSFKLPSCCSCVVKQVD